MRAAITRLMSLTLGDFLRILPQAVAPHAFSVQSDMVVIECAQGSVRIRFATQAPRKIASLSFSVLKVEIEFSGMTQSASHAFLEKFDRAFLRGGG